MIPISVQILRLAAVCLLGPMLVCPASAAGGRNIRHGGITQTHVYASKKHRATAAHMRSSEKTTAAHHRRVAITHADRPLIVIDPGHGGRDPGAVGASGTLEKTVNLAAAKQLQRLLVKSGRYRVVLTRTGDRTVSLIARLAFAREHHADLLIAIHADSSDDHSARGASVYVRSGAEATWLPTNQGNARSIADAIAASPALPDLGSVFLQLTMIDQLDDDVLMAAAPARSAPLFVLASHSTPSVLLEMGFLSNRRDEALLRRPAHRQVLVKAVRDAIDEYFDQKAGSRT